MNSFNEICINERPYEKVKLFGPGSLSDSELLAIFIRSGNKNKSCIDIAKELLGENAYDDGLLRITTKTYEDLQKVSGIGEVKAIQLVCMLEISKRIWRSTKRENLIFTDSKSVADYYMESLRHKSTEVTKVLYLNTKCMLIKEQDISSGTINASLITPREIYIQALNNNAVNIILMHNHPSGDPTPSESDDVVTRNVCAAGNILGVNMLDHIIIGDNKYYSYALNGRIGRL